MPHFVRRSGAVHVFSPQPRLRNKTTIQLVYFMVEPVQLTPEWLRALHRASAMTTWSHRRRSPHLRLSNSPTHPQPNNARPAAHTSEAGAITLARQRPSALARARVAHVPLAHTSDIGAIGRRDPLDDGQR